MRNNRNLWAWIIGGVVVILLVISIPYFVGQGPNVTVPRPTPQEPQGGGPPTQGGVSVSDIIGNSDAYIGKVVRVEGEVDDLISSRVFRLDQEGTIVGDEILVIARTSIPTGTTDRPLQDADDVRVEGTVRRLVADEVERELGIDLDGATETQFAGQPVIIADQVTALPENR